MAHELAKCPCQKHCRGQMVRRIQSRTRLWYQVIGAARTTVDRFKNKPKQGGHVLSRTVPKVSHQRGISAGGRFNLGLQGFQGFTWKNGYGQRSKDGVKGPFYEMMLVPTCTSSSESHWAAIVPHSCAFTCSYSPNMQIRSDMGL